ncbi:MAG: HAD-IB family hydrolase [Actinobacteria bacterium]|nr:HAD-IB family hydrolase [Actinomycetota bacterium]
MRDGRDEASRGARSAPTRAAAFFDLDKTVIKKPAMVAFARPLYDAGFITRRLVVRAAYNNLRFRGVRGPDAERMAKFRETGLRIVKGWKASDVRALVEATLPERLERTVYPAALNEMRGHQRAGRPVFLVSAEPEEIVVPLADHLGVDHVISSQATIDGDGRYTGETGSWIYGPEKASAMRAAAQRFGIDLEASYAYSDSATDIPMLECVGHPVAVNPDRALQKIAQTRDWEIRRYVIDKARPLTDAEMPGLASS